MKYVKLGNTGIDVSAICLGCMTYGIPDRGSHNWTLNTSAARPLLRQALELGINFFDTANIYSDGTSEEIVGKALKDFARRDEVVIATKVGRRMRPGPDGIGLSRRAIMQEIDDSLRRLGTDYVDLYQTHRWDPETPLAETLEALHDVVKAGKARYIGGSAMYAWQFATAVYTSRLNGWTEFVSMQSQLSLLYREEEREMLPFCRAENIAFTAWSPLARGRLTRDWNETSERQENDQFGKMLFGKTMDADRAVIERVGEIAKARGVPRAQVALAWLVQKAGVTSPIIGASKPHHLQDAVAALTLNLDDAEIVSLEAPYVSHALASF